jgi:hypothetical protein
MASYCLASALTLIKVVVSSTNGNAIGYPVGSKA